MAPSTRTNWTPVGQDSTHHYSATALAVFWTAAEHDKLIARWPRLTAEVGATWDEHRRQVERHCALITQAGHGVSQTPGDISGFAAFLADRRINTPSAEDLRAYPDLRSQPTMVPWPPARNARRHRETDR